MTSKSRDQTQRGRLNARTLMAVGFAAIAVSTAPAVQAQNEATVSVRPAQIHSGTCASPGDVVFELQDVVVLPNTRGSLTYAGAEGASVVEGSDSSLVPATLSDILNAPHLIAVFESEGSDAMVACGEIGGFMTSNDDDLAIGLREQADSGFAGVALLEGDDDDNEVDVDIFLARDVTGNAATPSASSGSRPLLGI